MGAYQRLTDRFDRIDSLAHLGSMASWDRMATMPEGGNSARSKALAALDVLVHQTLADPLLKADLDLAAGESLSEFERANWREMKRAWQSASALPGRLVEEKSMAGSQCEHAWRIQRRANDWTGFLVNFEKVLDVSRREARILGDLKGCSPYEALMDKYDPGATIAQIDAAFGDLKSWLPGLARAAIAVQNGQEFSVPKGPFPTEVQKGLGMEVMASLGFDFAHGRLDVSAHPFCGGVPSDVRITTVYNENDCISAMMGIVHETGHALYEQGLPKEWAGQPAGAARSMALHESQSLTFEMQIGASKPFLNWIAPKMSAAFGRQEAFDPENLIRLFTRVNPGLIRVHSDELTYPSHVILRYEIERDLIEGAIEARDVPAAWDEKMMSYLGVDSRGNYKDGCMQDIHWTDGSFGYFPSYTLGAMYAAQWMAKIKSVTPDFDERISKGDFSAVRGWLDANVWKKASLLSASDIALAATGETLNPRYFKEHLERRYLGVAPAKRLSL